MGTVAVQKDDDGELRLYGATPRDVLRWTFALFVVCMEVLAIIATILVLFGAFG